MQGRLIVFTDLDGTLLDYSTYSYEHSEEGMGLLRERDIPLIFCTSKSYAEVVYFREKTGNTSPFIVENGGAIYIPGGQAALFRRAGRPGQFRNSGGYAVIQLGADYARLRQVFEQIKREFHERVIGFGDMDVRKVASYLNLPPGLAGMAKERRYDEPFILEDPSLLDGIKQFAERRGLRVYPGTRFYHLMGDTDKGIAVKVLVSAYREMYGGLTSAAVGEGKNDEPMFRQVDVPYLVQRPDGKYVDIRMDNIVKIDKVGPEGFTSAVKRLLSTEGLYNGI